MSKDKIIDPIPDAFENVVDIVSKPSKEISTNAMKINVLAPKKRSKEITHLDLGIEAECEVNGIGMGVADGGWSVKIVGVVMILAGISGAFIILAASNS